MIFAKDIKKFILETVERKRSSNPVNPIDLAKSIDPNNWQIIVDQVRIVAESMLQDGQLERKNYSDPN